VVQRPAGPSQTAAALCSSASKCLSPKSPPHRPPPIRARPDPDPWEIGKPPTGRITALKGAMRGGRLAVTAWWPRGSGVHAVDWPFNRLLPLSPRSRFGWPREASHRWARGHSAQIWGRRYGSGLGGETCGGLFFLWSNRLREGVRMTWAVGSRTKGRAGNGHAAGKGTLRLF
jgi:hypothetical protein